LELPKLQDEKIKFESDSQIQTSIEPKLEPTNPSESSQSSQILPIELKSADTPKQSLPDMMSIIPDQPIADTNRERTWSDASSATVDYDFDTETCAVLASKSVDNDI